MRIKLLGRPHVVGADGEIPLRGKKTWGVVAKVLLSESPPSRRHLAAALFPDADDPMGALRWALGQIRRAIGGPDAFLGDPVEANLPASVSVDVLDLVAGSPDLGDLSGTLLEGVDAGWGPEFDAWLTVERLSVDNQVYAALRSDALRALATNQTDRAIERARLMIERAPFDEAGHVLMIKALVASGDTSSAEKRVQACEQMFRDELGVEPTAALRSAARPNVAAPAPGVSADATTKSFLESGSAAIDAGAPDAGIECLRQAVFSAQRGGDRHLEATAQSALGSALVHAVRGFDDEGAVALARAVELSAEVGEPGLAAGALTELAYVDVIAGRRTEAEGTLRQAMDAAGDRVDLLAGVTTITAFNQADWGRASEAADTFRAALDYSERAKEPRRIAYALGLGARTLVEVGAHDEATAWIARALTLIAEERWIAFRPWVEALGYEQALDLDGPLDDVRSGLEQTFALSCQLADPCWEGVAAQGIGSVCAKAGDVDDAFAWFVEARTRCTRVTDTYVWIEASSLHREAELAIEIGDESRGASAASELLSHSARHQLDGFVASARDQLTHLGEAPGTA